MNLCQFQGHKLKAMLEPEGYEVWCSTDLVEVNGGHGDAGSTPDETSDDRMPMRRASQEGRLRSIPTLPSVCSDCISGALG